jgi:hypothetical protein
MAAGAVVGGHELMADHQREGEHAAGLDLILIGADRAEQQAQVVHAPVVNAPESATTWSRRAQYGTTFSHEVRDFPGMPPHPFIWDDVVGKVDQIVAGRIGSDLANQIKEAVRSVEQIQVKDLMALLTRVRVG